MLVHRETKKESRAEPHNTIPANHRREDGDARAVSLPWQCSSVNLGAELLKGVVHLFGY